MTSDDERERWAGAFIRDRRVAMAVSDWDALEAAYRRAYPFPGGPRAGASQRELMTYLLAHGEAIERLTYQGEIVLMFADAATNALAEAILGSWGVAVKQPTLRVIIEGLESGGYGRYEPDLSTDVDQLRMVYLGVNFPRHVLAVHPPDGKTVNVFQFGKPTYMGWTRPWDPEDPEWNALLRRVTDETLIPKDMAGTPDRLLAWTIDHPEGLSRESRKRLQAYAKRNGAFVSPTRAAAKIQEVIRDMASRFGYRREDFFSD